MEPIDKSMRDSVCDLLEMQARCHHECVGLLKRHLAVLDLYHDAIDIMCRIGQPTPGAENGTERWNEAIRMINKANQTQL